MSEQRPLDQRYQLIALDIDGTLLDDGGNLSQRTRATVGRVMASGVIVVLATSRRFTGASPVAKTLELHGPLVLYDGAQIREYPGGEIISSEVIERDTARQAITSIAEQGLRPIAQYATKE